jgi:hypothetical protein
MKSSIAVVIAVFGLFVAMDYSFSLPDVHVSYSTGTVLVLLHIRVYSLTAWVIRVRICLQNIITLMSNN